MRAIDILIEYWRKSTKELSIHLLVYAELLGYALHYCMHILKALVQHTSSVTFNFFGDHSNMVPL